MESIIWGAIITAIATIIAAIIVKSKKEKVIINTVHETVKINNLEKNHVDIQGPKSYIEIVGKQIKNLRENYLELSDGDFSRSVGVQEVHYLEKIEKGFLPYIDFSFSTFVEKVCDFFHVRLEWLEKNEGAPFVVFASQGSVFIAEDIDNVLSKHKDAEIRIYREKEPSTFYRLVSILLVVKTKTGHKYFPFLPCSAFESSGGGKSCLMSILKVIKKYKNTYSFPMLYSLPRKVFNSVFQGTLYPGKIKYEYKYDEQQISELLTAHEIQRI